jgi:hypothetical protein
LIIFLVAAQVPLHGAWVTTIAAGDSIRDGTDVPIVEARCGEIERCLVISRS